MQNKTPYKRAEDAWDDTIINTSKGIIEVENDLDSAMNGEEWKFCE